MNSDSFYHMLNSQKRAKIRVFCPILLRKTRQRRDVTYDVIDKLRRLGLSKCFPALCHKYRIWNEFSFHTVFMKRVVCFISPSLWRGDIKHTTSFINAVWNKNSFQILFITWSFRKISIFHEKSMYFEKISRENRPEASCFTRRHNAPSLSSYDVTDKEAPNWCKKCYVTCVLLENLWNGFWKGKSCDKLIYEIAIFHSINWETCDKKHYWILDFIYNSIRQTKFVI